MVPVFEEECFILLYFEVILQHNIIRGRGRLFTLDVGVHGAIIISRVLGSIYTTMLLLQFLEIIFYFLLSL